MRSYLQNPANYMPINYWFNFATFVVILALCGELHMRASLEGEIHPSAQVCGNAHVLEIVEGEMHTGVNTTGDVHTLVELEGEI